MASKTEPCSGCDRQPGVGEKDFERCSRCLSVHYCSEACQRSHWVRGHREKCKSAAATSSASSAPAPNNTTSEPEEDLSVTPVCCEPPSLGDCPVCFDPLVDGPTLAHAMCCGAFICKPCSRKVIKCPLCRHPYPSTEEGRVALTNSTSVSRPYHCCPCQAIKASL